jgi:hypothetical protein
MQQVTGWIGIVLIVGALFVANVAAAAISWPLAAILVAGEFGFVGLVLLAGALP